MEKINARTLDVILDKVLEETGLRDQLITVQVYEAWDRAIGPRNANAVISRYFTNGVLYCTLSSSSLRNMLYFNLEGTRKRINSDLGGEYLKKIVLR